MLGFTHNSRMHVKNVTYEQPDYQPIVIVGSTDKQKKMPQPKMESKKIIKTHSNFKIPTKISPQKQFKNKVSRNRKDWNSGYVNNKEGVFDRQIKKDTLAAEQRRYRAKSKKNVDQKKKQIMSKQQQMFYKKTKAYEEQKDKQIQHLKQLIEKQRLEKQRNDQLYEQKKRQIQAERKQLILLQKRIQKEGPKAKNLHQERLRQITPENYPANDRAKCRQQIQNLPFNKTGFAQITQSQSIANQKNKIRQKQLQYLIDQREKNHLQYQRNTLGYTPTLIPLLSKASYKIISTHVTSLVQLFIDDLLQEQVLLLQKIQLEQSKRKQLNKEKQILEDYAKNLEEFVDQAGYIESKVGRYSKLKFEQIYHKPQISSQYNSGFKYDNPLMPLYYNLNLNLSHQSLEQIEERIKKFHRFVQNFAEYKPEQLKAMKDVTQQIIDEALLKLAKQLDNGAGDFVNIIFRGQFQ